MLYWYNKFCQCLKHYNVSSKHKKHNFSECNVENCPFHQLKYDPMKTQIKWKLAQADGYWIDVITSRSKHNVTHRKDTDWEAAGIWNDLTWSVPRELRAKLLISTEIFQTLAVNFFIPKFLCWVNNGWCANDVIQIFN